MPQIVIHNRNYSALSVNRRIRLWIIGEMFRMPNSLIFKATKREHVPFVLHSVCWIFWYLKEYISKWYLEQIYLYLASFFHACIYFYFIERAEHWFTHENNVNKRYLGRGDALGIMWQPSVYFLSASLL